MADDKKSREKTGINGLDEFLSGGLEKDKVFLVAGEVGTGKTITCLQFIRTGLENGENALYLTAGDKPSDILKSANSMGWDLGGYIRDRKFSVIDISPQNFKAAVGNILSVNETIDYFYKLVSENNVKRLVIDSIELIPASLSKENLERLNYLRNLVTAIEGDLECTTLITSIIPSGTNQLSMFGIMEHSVSGIITLKINEDTSQRLICIRKMRADGISLTKHVYTIEKTKGIVIKELISSQEANRSVKDTLTDASVVKPGSFTLASGKESNYYVDVKSALTNPAVLEEITTEISKRVISKKIAGVETGSIPLLAAVSLKLKIPYLIIKKEDKKHGIRDQFTGEIVPGETIDVIEDVVTTAKSVSKGIDVLQENGAKVSRVICVVDREDEGRGVLLKKGIVLIELAKISELKK